jgi:very-short-patch-repair endonuclease
MKQEFKEEHLLTDCFVRPDFFLPQANLAIEINGRSHYYPMSTRYNNYTNLTTKLLRMNGHNILHLNSWVLEGMMANKDGIKDLLTKTINTYSQKKPAE